MPRHVRQRMLIFTSKVLPFYFRYAPDNEWFIQTMNEVFELGGNLVRPEVAHNLMRLIGEGMYHHSDGY